MCKDKESACANGQARPQNPVVRSESKRQESTEKQAEANKPGKHRCGTQVTNSQDLFREIDDFVLHLEQPFPVCRLEYHTA
jgi:hypothetical protein